MLGRCSPHLHGPALAVLVFLTTVPLLLRAQVWEIFDVNTAGLPFNTVRAIAPVSNGDVWVGTEFGLCRYDGVDWEVYQTMTHPLPDNDIRALAEDAWGRLWIGTSQGGLVLFDGQSWTTFDGQNSPLPDEQVRCIASDTGGFVWVGTTEGLVRTDGTDWRVYDDSPGSHAGLQLPGRNIASVTVRQDGLVCVGSLNAGFIYLTDTSVTYFDTVNNGLPDNTALGVALDQQGDRWVACPAGALLLHAGPFDGGAWLQFSTLNSFIPSNALNDVVVDGAGRKIVATQNAGVAMLTDPNSWVSYTEQNSMLPDNEVLCLAMDLNGALWIGTAGGGAARLSYAVDVPEHGTAVLSVHPVPSQGIVQVQLQGPDSQWQLFDAMGRQVEAGWWWGSMGTLDLGRRSAGSYVLLVREADGTVRRARLVRE